MARVAFLVDEMFEDAELRVPHDRVRSAGHEAVIVGLVAGKELVGKRGGEAITTERAAGEIAAGELDAVVIPGGCSPDHLRTSDDGVALVRNAFRRGIPVAAISHAGWMLIEAGIAYGRTLTSWPSLKTDLLNAGARWIDREVVEDGNLITSRGPDDLPAFYDALARQIEYGPPQRPELIIAPERPTGELAPGARNMLDRIFWHLRAHAVSFRLTSRASSQPDPSVAHVLSPAGLRVETQVLLVGGLPAISCAARGAKLSLARLRHELGVEVLEGSPADLPPPYSLTDAPIPPLGGAMDVVTLVDTQVTQAPVIAFMAFSTADYIELPYDEFARLERPRVASFAVGGELPPSSEAQEPERKVA